MKADPSPTRSRVETAIGIDLGDKRILRGQRTEVTSLNPATRDRGLPHG